MNVRARVEGQKLAWQGGHETQKLAFSVSAT